MKKLSLIFLLTFALSPFFGIAHASPKYPRVTVCREATDPVLQQDNYKVTIAWGDFKSDAYTRLDLVAEDRTGAAWPQFRDNRLMSNSKTIIQRFTVDGRSQYPLQFFIIGYKNYAEQKFDLSCTQDHICYSDLKGDDVVDVGGQGDVILSPNDVNKGCDQ